MADRARPGGGNHGIASTCSRLDDRRGDGWPRSRCSATLVREVRQQPGHRRHGRRTGADSSEGAPVDGGSLVVGVAAETNGWNPALGQWADAGSMVGSSVLEPLAAIGPDKGAKPWLADSWIANETFDKWVIHLHPNVKFQNGEDFTADVVKKNIEFYLNGTLSKIALEPMIDGVDVIDPLTIQVNLKQPWGAFPERLDDGQLLHDGAGHARLGRQRRGPPDRHRAVHVRQLGERHVVQGQEEPELLAGRSAPPRLDRVPGHPRRDLPGGRAHERRRQHDPHHPGRRRDRPGRHRHRGQGLEHRERVRDDEHRRRSSRARTTRCRTRTPARRWPTRPTATRWPR